MKKIWSLTSIFLLTSLLLLFRCTSGESNNSSEKMSSLFAISNYVTYDEIDPITKSYSDLSIFQDYNYYHVNIPEQAAGQNVSFDYTFNTNGNTKDIYFIFTNTSPSVSSSYPLIDENQSVSQAILPENAASKPKILVSSNQTMKGKPEISEFNRNPYAFLNKINPVNMLLSIVPPSLPKYDNEGDSNTFKIDPYLNVTAQCKKVNTDGTKILNDLASIK